MTLTAALRWSLYDRALALGPLLLGLLVAGAGVWIGAGAYTEELLFGDPSDAAGPASTPIAVAGIVLGVVVWQVGRGAVRHYTLRAAMNDPAVAPDAGGAGATEPSSVVRDAVADLENDVQTLSRKTTRLEQELHGDSLGTDALDVDDPDPASSSDPTSTTATAGAGTGGGGSAATESTSSGSTAADAAGGEWPGAGGGQDAAEGAAGDDASADAEAAPENGLEDDGTGETDDDAAAAESDDEFEWEGEDGEYYRNG